MLYKYKRLPYGVASAPAIFHKFIETMLRGIPNVVYYIDDILVTEKNDYCHVSNLSEDFKRLREHGIRANSQK